MKLITASLLLLAASASAATFTLNPIEDAFVSSANPNSNYGGAGALAVSAAGLSKGEFDSLLKFDLSGAKANFDSTFGAGRWAIDSITLQLTATTPNNAIFNGNGTGPGGTNVNSAGLFSIKWMQNDSWVEGTGTPAVPTANGIVYSTLSSFLSASDETLSASPYSFGGDTTGNNTWNLDRTLAFTADVTAGNTMSLLMLPADSAVSYLSNARSFGTVSSRPLLTVNASATPEPATASLLLGAAVFCLPRRRKHARTA